MDTTLQKGTDERGTTSFTVCPLNHKSYPKRNIFPEYRHFPGSTTLGNFYPMGGQVVNSLFEVPFISAKEEQELQELG